MHTLARSLSLLALTSVLAACSDSSSSPTGPTTVRQLRLEGQTKTLPAPAASLARPSAATTQPTVTLVRVDGSSRSYQVPPEFIEDGAVWYVLTVDGIRYEQDGSIWRERTSQEIADKAVRDMRARRGAFGP